MDRRFLIFGAIAVSAIAIQSPAQARGLRLPFGAALRGLRGAGKTYGANHLTQAQLEQCLLEGKELDAKEVGLKRNDTQLSAMQSEVDWQFNRLKAEERLVDQYSQESVDAFNASISQYEYVQRDFNVAVNRHNAALNEFNAAVSKYNSKCADRLYYEDDMIAAREAVGIFD